MARVVPSEATLLRRAGLVLALQSALAVAAILALVGAVTFGLVVRDQRLQVSEVAAWSPR